MLKVLEIKLRGLRGVIAFEDCQWMDNSSWRLARGIAVREESSAPYRERVVLLRHRLHVGHHLFAHLVSVRHRLRGRGRGARGRFDRGPAGPGEQRRARRLRRAARPGFVRPEARRAAGRAARITFKGRGAAELFGARVRAGR